MVLEKIAEPIACAGRVAREDGRAAFLAQRLQVIDHRLIDVGMGGALGREVARAVDVEVDHGGGFGLVERRGNVRGRGGERFLPFLGRHVERLGGKRAVAAGLRCLGALAVLVIIGDRLEPRLAGGLHAAVADDQRVLADMVEQRLEPLLEQRQPMFHAGQAAAFADRLVERVTRRGGAKGFAIAAAEALDAFLVQQRLGRGEEGEAGDLAGGTLVGGIEGAHALDLVTEEVEPKRLRLARGEEIDQATAHGIFAGVVHRIGAHIAVGGEQRGELVACDPLTRFQVRDQLADAERGERALRGGVDGGEDKLRRLGGRLQLVQRADPLRHDAQGGRGPVIEKAVPRGIFDDLDLRREEARGAGDRAHRRFVRRDEHRPRRRRAGEIGEQAGQEAGRHAREGERRLGGENRLQIGQRRVRSYRAAAGRGLVRRRAGCPGWRARNRRGASSASSRLPIRAGRGWSRSPSP